MQNKDLARDYIERAGHRLAAVAVLVERQSFADVVRESQEVVELCLKGLLRHYGIEVPRLHDVSDILKAHRNRLEKIIPSKIDRLCKISKNLRRDRELSFYGTEDLTPSEFYEASDGNQAFEDAEWAYTVCKEGMR